MDIERECFETETDLENLLFDKTVEFRKSLREPVSVKRFPYGWGKEAVFVKILQKNWLGVFLSLKNLSRGFAPTLRYPRIFF